MKHGEQSTRGATNPNPNKSNPTPNEDKKHNDSKLGEVEYPKEQRQKRELEEKNKWKMKKNRRVTPGGGGVENYRKISEEETKA